MYDFLKQIDFFSKLPEADLERISQMVEEVRLSAGQELFAEGSPGDRAYIIQEGALDIIKISDGREVLLETHRDKPGLMIGEMALLEEAPRMASVRAHTDAVLLALDKEQFHRLLETSPAATRAMLDMVMRRWRNNEARLRQSNKMVQLGTLTAGIAHELNNPAAAVKRSTGQLETAIAQFGQAQAQISQLKLTKAQQDILQDLAQQAQEGISDPSGMDALARSDLEAELEEWLDEREVDGAWEFVPALVNMNYDIAKLTNLAELFSADELSIVIGWINATCVVYDLLKEIGEGAERVSAIVKALREYAYLGQAPVQTIDVHEGLNNTLLILRHKLKQGIKVRREYAKGLPQFQAYGTELNQVWTNIIDNAADALGGQGEITIRTRQEGDRIVVEIEDNGPGIPQNIVDRIFDPFFTTKPPGQGTGMGLDISYNIIVHRHRGDIKVESQPGKTCFQIWLPKNLKDN